MMTAMESSEDPQQSPRNRSDSKASEGEKEIDGDEEKTDGDQDKPNTDDGKTEKIAQWKKLVAVLTVATIPLIVLGALRPFDRIIDVLLPPQPLPNQHSNDPQSILAFNPPLFPTRSQFPFRQCKTNATMCCNGLENACDLRINQVMFATVHNAMAAKENGYLLNPNHFFSLEAALEAGYRGLNLEVCKCNGVYEFCHGVCRLGSRNPIEVFLNLDRFLRDNRHEVILLNLSINNEVHQPVNLHEFYEVMKNATRFNTYLYSHYKEGDDWPTLREMINTGKRILLFHSQGPTCANITCPPGMHHWGEYGRETDEVNQDRDVDAMSEQCHLNGEHPLVKESRQFHGLNHYVPTENRNQVASKKLNSYGFLSTRIESCAKKHPKIAFNFVSVDHFSVGDVVEFVQRQNKARIA